MYIQIKKVGDGVLLKTNPMPFPYFYVTGHNITEQLHGYTKKRG